MSKKLLLLLVLFPLLFSTVHAAIGFYLNTWNGYVNSADNIGVEDVSVTVTCYLGGFTGGTQHSTETIKTNSGGSYSFTTQQGPVICSGDDCLGHCDISTNPATTISSGPITIQFTIKNGEIASVRGSTNFLRNIYLGSSCFSFTGVTGTITDSNGLLIRNRDVTLSCGGSAVQTVQTNDNGYYAFTKNDYSHACTGTQLSCLQSCTVDSTDSTPGITSFQINATGDTKTCTSPEVVTQTVSFSYNYNADVTGTFTPPTQIYGPSFTQFTFTANGLSGGQTINACKYSSTQQDYNVMTQLLNKIGNDYSGSVNPSGTGTYNYYVACNTSHTLENAANNEVISYTFDLDDPVINNVNNDTKTMNSIPLNVTISLDENSTCQVSSADTGYNYVSTNCTNNYTTIMNCSLSSLLLTEGFNNYYVSCADQYGNTHNSSENRLVTYNIDLTNPSYTTLSNALTFTENDTAEVNWTLTDANPSHYTYYYEGSLQETTTWNSPALIEKNVNTVTPGIYNYTIYFNDTAGRTNQSTILVTILDGAPPLINVINPLNSAVFNYLTISMNVSLLEDGKGCIAEYAGTNHTMNNLTSRDYGLIDSFPEGINSISFYCNDSYNSTGVNNTMFTLDVTPPFVVTRNSTSTFNMNTTNNITWTLADAYTTGYYNVSINNTHYFNATQWNNNTHFNVPADTNRGIGTWAYTIYYNDTVNNIGTDTVIVNVVDQNLPIITIDNPQSTLYGYTTHNMNITLNEAGNNCEAEYAGSNHTMNKYSPYTYRLTDAFNNGWNTISFYCNDSYNNTGVNSVTFEIDVANPSVEIVINDSNVEYGYEAVNLSLTVSDAHLDSCVFNVSLPTGGLILENSGNDIILGPSELTELGYYSVKAYCNDTLTNENYTTTNFLVSDTMGPTVYLHTPPTLSLLAGTILFNCSASNMQLVNNTLYGSWSGWHANETLPITGSWNYSIFNKDLPTGTYEWNCLVCDASNNCNYSNTNYTFELDNTNPSVEILINDTVLEYDVEAVNLSLTVSDAHLDSCVFNVSLPTGGLILENSGNDIILGPSELTELGYYSVKAYCNDTLTNENYTSKSFEVADNVPPIITIINPSLQYYTSNYVLFNVSLNDVGVWCGAQVDSETSNRTLQKINDYSFGLNESYSSGGHVVTFYCNDTANNIGMNSTTFTVENTPPVIENVTFSLANQSIIGLGANMSFYADVYDALPGISTVIFEDYAIAQPLTGNTYYHDVTCQSTQEYWTTSVFANDTLNNINTVINNTIVWYCDTQSPIITSTEINNTLLYDASVARLNCSSTDQGYSSVQTTTLGTNTGVLSAFQGVGSEWFLDFTCNQTTWNTLTNYSLTWFNTTSEDYVNNINSINHSYSLICDPFPPQIHTLPSVPESMPKDSTVCLTSNVSDYPGHLSKVWVNISVEPYSGSDYWNVYYMKDDGLGCDALINDGVFGYELLLNEYGYFNVETVFANDTGDQVGSRVVYDNVYSYDNSPPDIKAWQVLGSYALNNGEETMLRARVQDSPNGVDKVVFEVSGVNYTHETRSFDWYQYNITCSYDYDYDWNMIFANDTANNLASLSISPANITCDVYYPTISNPQVNDVAVTQLEGFCVNTTANDTHLDKVWVMTTSPTGAVYNYTLYDTGSSCGGEAGDNVYGANVQPLPEYGVWFVNSTFANDSYNHISMSSRVDIQVNTSALDSPFIGMCEANNTLLQSGDSVRLSCTVTDDEGVNSVLFTLNGVNTTITNNITNTYYYEETCTANKIINWTMVYANDTGIPTNESYYPLSVLVYCDVENPSITNADYGMSINLNDYLCFNATITDNDLIVNPLLALSYPNNTYFTQQLLDDCASGCCGTGGDNVYGARIQLTEAGDYYLFNASVSDRVGNFNYATYNVNITSSDVYNPAVSNVTVIPNGSLNQYSLININATITDYSLDYQSVHIITPTSIVDVYLNDSIGSPSGDDVYGAVFNLTERGQYNIQHVFANDSYINSLNYSTNIMINSNDVYSPVISNITVNPSGTLSVFTNITVSATINDNDALQGVWFNYLDPESALRTANLTSAGGDLWSAQLNLTLVGVYNLYNVSAMDLDNNTAVQPISTAITSNDTVNPNIISASIVPSGNVNQYTNICVSSSINENDVLAYTRLYANYPNNTKFNMLLTDTCTVGCCGTIGDNLWGVIINLTEPGYYYFNNITTVDLNNNKDSHLFNQSVQSVDVYKPVISIISPVNATYDVNNITLSFQVVNDNYVSSTWYNINNGENITCSTVEDLSFPDGHYSLRVFANDSYNNLGVKKVEFTVSVEDNIKDLSVLSVSVPAEAYSNEPFTVIANITNEGNVDAVNASVKTFVDGSLKKTEYVYVLVNDSLLYSTNLTITSTGSRNITVFVVPFPEETDRVDNSGTDFINIKSYINDISPTISAPKFVAPNTNFTTNLYVYNYATKMLTVNNNLTLPVSFTGFTSNPSTINVQASNLNTSQWLSRTGTAGNYTLTTTSYITGQPGTQVRSKNIEVKEPASPLFSVDVSVIPPVFFAGVNNTVIADIYNYGNETATSVNATIIVPPGITVFGNTTHYLADLVNGTSNQTTWVIQPNSTGSYNISVIAKYMGGSDSDNETVGGGALQPNLSVADITYDDSIENNTNIDYYFKVYNTGAGTASDVFATLVLGNNTKPVKINDTFSVSPGGYKQLRLNFTATTNGTGNSFKLVVQHVNSSFYYEKINTYDVWIDNTPPTEKSVVTGFSTVEGYNLISWTPVTDAYKYYIYKGINGVTDFNVNTPNATVSYTVTSWVDTKVELNKWYYYRVAGVDYAGNIGPLSEYVKVIPKDFFTQEDEVEQLQDQLSDLQDKIDDMQDEVLVLAQVNSNINNLLREMDYFNNISVLLTPEEYQKINSVRTTLLTAQSKTVVGDKQLWLNQAEYELSTFPDYSVGTQRHVYSNKVGNLTIDTTENVIRVTFSNKQHNKYSVVKRLLNENDFELQNITLYFDLPNDVILVNSASYTLVNDTIMVFVESLKPGELFDVEYSFYTYNDYVNDLASGLMSSVAPLTLTKPITGFIGSVFAEADEADFNPYYIAIVWAGVILMGFAYFQKTRIMNWYNKVKDYVVKGEEDEEGNMIRIKIEKE